MPTTVSAAPSTSAPTTATASPAARWNPSRSAAATPIGPPTSSAPSALLSAPKTSTERPAKKAGPGRCSSPEAGLFQLMEKVEK